jgi:hypothetical protein
VLPAPTTAGGGGSTYDRAEESPTQQPQHRPAYDNGADTIDYRPPIVTAR